MHRGPAYNSQMLNLILFRMPPSVAAWAPLPLRLIIGYGFMQHGFSKLAAGPNHFAGILNSIGVPAADVMARLTIGVEIFGGLAVLLGAFVTIAAAPMAAVVLVAAATVHLRYGFSSIKLLAATASGAQFGPPGYELDLLYVAALVVLVMLGAGPLSIDSFLRKRYVSAPSVACAAASRAMGTRYGEHET